MSDTPPTPSNFRHRPSPAILLGCAAVFMGLVLRCLATQGELWLDEVWSLIKVSQLSSPIEIVTKVKHDNNHILNSLWMWLWGPRQSPLLYRAPSLLFSAIFLGVLLVCTSARLSSRSSTLWLTMVAFSYPLTLYGTEARGYALTLLCAACAFFSLTRLSEDPFNRRAIGTFAIAGIVGCLSHAIYALFLAPAVAWLLGRMVSPPLRLNSRAILWFGIAPPVLLACGLTLTFYRHMEIGGAPLLPYLEVAASAISVSFGGETLSSINPAVTGWNIFLGIAIMLACLAELVAWARCRSPLASLVGLILSTPWVAVSVLQPHFILPRYFIIQIFFAYLLAARFLDRLIRQGACGTAVAAALLGGFVLTNTTHILALVQNGRSHFVRVFETIASKDHEEEITVGGDQDFQNTLRLSYARILAPETARIVYVPNYQTAPSPPRYIVRETIEGYEIFPHDLQVSSGVTYQRVQQYHAPQLNGSHVTVYEIIK